MERKTAPPGSYTQRKRADRGGVRIVLCLSTPPAAFYCSVFGSVVPRHLARRMFTDYGSRSYLLPQPSPRALSPLFDYTLISCCHLARTVYSVLHSICASVFPNVLRRSSLAVRCDVFRLGGYLSIPVLPLSLLLLVFWILAKIGVCSETVYKKVPRPVEVPAVWDGADDGAAVGGGGSSSAEELREEPRRERNVDGPDRGVGTVGRRCRRRRRAASVVVHRRAVSARVASRWTVRSKACAHGIGGSRCHSGGLRDTLNRCTFACLVLSSTSHHVRPPLTGRHSYYVCNRRSQIDLWRLQRWIYAAASSTSSL
uniref:Uncharacterized protein n=1 Tax=Plectus sambesii TaxID=2011161 RepID=A0A914V431_9BILA